MSSEVTLRVALPTDVPALLTLMPGYYAADGLPFDARRAENSMTRLLTEQQWGRVWLAEINGRAVGYMALCFGFSLEAGGNDAFVDELYVLPAHRSIGLGRKLLELALQEARRLGVETVHLLIRNDNERARQLYASNGFARRKDFYLMSKHTT